MLGLTTLKVRVKIMSRGKMYISKNNYKRIVHFDKFVRKVKTKNANRNKKVRVRSPCY